MKRLDGNVKGGEQQQPQQFAKEGCRLRGGERAGTDARKSEVAWAPEVDRSVSVVCGKWGCFSRFVRGMSYKYLLDGLKNKNCQTKEESSEEKRPGAHDWWRIESVAWWVGSSCVCWGLPARKEEEKEEEEGEEEEKEMLRLWWRIHGVKGEMRQTKRNNVCKKSNYERWDR